MRIGFVGLGQMGKPMALNMLKSGAELIVSDVRIESFPEFEKRGARTTTNLPDMAQAEIIFLSLPNSDIVESVVSGEKGLIDKLHEGQILVDLSTIAYAATVEIAKRLERRCIVFVDAPVSGMEARAKEGTLTVM